MEWYIPMTIIPGIGLIILSTSNIMLALNNEISNLEDRPSRNSEIIKSKLSQLKSLSISIVFQYLGVLFFLLSGIVASVLKTDFIPHILLFVGVGVISISIVLLLFYSIKSVSIRQKHLNI